MRQTKNWIIKSVILTGILAIVSFLLFLPSEAIAEGVIPDISINIGDAQADGDMSSGIQILLLLTVLSIAPSILIMMTSFTRVIIILSFLRNALGTQQMPPNQVLIGLALFISLFIMSPVLQEINDTAYGPYSRSELTQQVALEKSSDIIKQFMVKQMVSVKREKDLAFFISLSGRQQPESVEELEKLPLSIIVPAFMISELTVAFKFGFLIFLPFIVIDMVVSSTLMSMGMMMLPPTMISLPFKIMLFILVDGWQMVIQSIVKSFF